MSKISEYILELLYPSACPFCGRLKGSTPGACPECEKKLPYVPEPLKEQHFKSGLTTASPLYYDAAVRQSLLKYKFGGRIAFCRSYAQIIAKTVDLSRYSCDYISWVPLSKKRRRTRGYNQAELIARELSKLTGLECGPVLIKQRDNKAQSGTGSREERLKNVKGVYAIKKGSDITGKRILLVDDIVTTGATLSECAAVLREGGAEALAVTVARSKE